jgi:arabinan endo-1,5-alpha-L-arabinosidase
MKKKLTIIILAMFAIVLSGCLEVEESSPIPTEVITYQNPVWEPILADPAIIRHDGTFYAYGTQDYGQWGEFDFGVRYIPILESQNLIDWTYAGSVFTLQTRPIWGTPNAGLWAPDIVKIGDTFLLYYSLSTWGDPDPGIGVASAPHPLGPWTDHGALFRSIEIGVNNSIDPAVFEADGKVYMIWGSFRGLYGLELSSDGLSLKDGANAKNTKVHIAGLDTTLPWNGATYEAPYIIYRNGYYYMFVSSGSCCNGHQSTYNVRVSRSTSPLGPYIDHQGRSMLGTYRGFPVLMGNSFFAGPGHNSVITDDAGNDYIVYHAFNTKEPGNYGNSPRRSLMIDLLEWDENGWPFVFGLMPSNKEVIAPVINQ